MRIKTKEQELQASLSMSDVNALDSSIRPLNRSGVSEGCAELKASFLSEEHS